MKKSLSLTLAAVLAFGTLLAACSSDKTASTAAPSASPTVSTAPSAAPATPAPPAATRPEIKKEGLIPAWDNAKNPAQATNRKDMMVIGMTAPDGVFNPFYVKTAYDGFVVDTVFDSLLTYNKDGTLAPELAAEMPKVSDDKLTYTFKLKPDLKFSDGSPLTAADVEFGFYVLLDASYDGDLDYSKYFIKGGDAYKAGTTDKIEGIKVIDPLTIEIQTTQTVATALEAFGGMRIAPKAYYGKDYKQGKLDYMKDLHGKPLGAGPYSFVSFAPGQEVVFKANPNYHLGTPKIPNLVYKVTTDETNMQMIQAGETDMDEITVSPDSVNALVDLGFLNTTLFPTSGYGYIAFNHKRDKFKDKNVRKALTIGLDRKQIVEAVFGDFAEVINIPQSKLSWAYTTEGIETYDFDLEKAKKLLDDAGWKVGADGIREKDGVKFEINFVASTPNSVNPAIIPVATANYKELGINFVPEQMDFNAATKKREAGEFDMLFMAWGLGPDPDSTNTFKTNGSLNEIGYSNPKVDQLLADGLKELDPEKRKPIYHELYKELNDDLPYIFMYQRRDMWPINARIQGFDFSPYKDFSSVLEKVQIQ